MPVWRTTGTRLGGVVYETTSVQVTYQPDACGDTENKRSSSGCAAAPTKFALRVCNGLRLKHKFVQLAALAVTQHAFGLTNRLYNGKILGAVIDFDDAQARFEVREGN